MASAKRAPPIVYYGEYLVKKSFGEGGQSRTFLAEKGAMSNKFFILKLVRYFTDKEQEQAEKEIEQLERLKSPFTVHLICSFVDRTDMCMVFEFCERGDLRTEIKELQNLPIKERVMNVWEIFAQMALSMNHLHTHDVIHCDIKPENIFVMADRSVKMGDFGLLKVLTDQSYAMTVVGTKPYMAPEVLINKMMDKQRQHPFAAKSEQTMIDKIRMNDVAKLPEQVPKDLADLVMSMMNPDECRRPQITEIIDNSTIQMYIRQHNSKSKSILQESDEKVRIAEKRAIVAEERLRQAEEKARQTELQLRAAEEQIKVTEEKARLAEEHARIADIKSQQSQFSASLNTILQKMNVPEGDEGRVEGNTFIHSNDECDSTITMDPIINQGVARFEVAWELLKLRKSLKRMSCLLKV
ncbi:MAG: putative NEK protein kinase [Streblomastix strix]|uniref:non-specific serine/threonine protein kinase n=2 Tax=Streblomastix strix TaxID=222440 RepID=A0A5J4WTD4_9EUKA|nr:MAG: putative NEK protein kinase [Streblomastix strix]